MSIIGTYTDDSRRVLREQLRVDPAELAEFKQDFPADGGMLRVGHDDLEASFAGHEVHVDPVFMIGAVTLNLDALPDKPPDQATPLMPPICRTFWAPARPPVPGRRRSGRRAGPGRLP